MQYGTITGLDKPVSRIVFGTAYGSLLNGTQRPEELAALLDTAIANGINTIDTAKAYGQAQAMIGNWLKGRDDRDQLVIETKGCHPLDDGTERVTKRDLDEDVDDSLNKLNTDYIDIYLLHRDNPQVPAGEIVEWLNEHHQAGRIKAFGGSNWSPNRIAEANAYAAEHGLVPFTVSSPNYSLAVQEGTPWAGVCTTLNGDDMQADREWYRDNRMAVFAYSVLGRGFMTGMFRSDDRATAEARLDEFARRGYCYPDNFERLRRAEILAAERGVPVAQIAVAWVFTQGLDMYALLSCTSDEIIRSNAAALDICLTETEAAWLNLEIDAR
ncbi:aldo/keto reductase [Bifidobacterium oedipodis]|uniref:Aldo/keto reductase n=1 Tax=Bifidobacterium oedipodis TaxID=2675322 RepID=A0A7Y0EPB0_9BIFI|nr:aldo/keto reductase [Bifidobacterium sp. DSM 109957]NMM93959.1 aldo/keto reductase [Bifidobacterium sp. DSM 109957]